MKQKVIITKSQSEINDWLSNGWRVISVTPQQITGPAPDGYGFETGKFCFVIEKSV